eukprot:4108184-Prorocentrum_lima.AAC.1
MTNHHVPIIGEGAQKAKVDNREGLYQHYKQGHTPKRKDWPVCQQTSGPVVRHHLRSDRAEKYGTLHVDLTG